MFFFMDTYIRNKLHLCIGYEMQFVNTPVSYYINEQFSPIFRHRERGCAENENYNHYFVTRTDFVFYHIYIFAQQMAFGSLLPSHLETRRSEHRSATRPYRKGILNYKQNTNLVIFTFY
jgi:hypothetical protein